MSVTVFAETSTQTVSVSVPDCDYTVTIPEDCSIEYGNTGIQSLGKITIASMDWEILKANKKAVYVSISSTSGDLINENGKRFHMLWGGYTDTLKDHQN